MSRMRAIAPFAVVGLVLAVWWIAAAQSMIFPTPQGAMPRLLSEKPGTEPLLAVSTLKLLNAIA